MANAHRFYVPVGVVSLAAPPVGPSTGDTYFDTTLGRLQSWDGTTWVGASSDAELDAQFVDAAGDAMTGELSLLDQVTTPPSAPATVSTKGYVDQLVTVSTVPPSAPPARDGLVWAVSPFSPDSSIPGLGLWIDPAQDTFADGEKIVTYTDHSPAHHVLTSFVGQEPIFRAGAKPHIEFTTPGWGLENTASTFNAGPDGLTMVVVSRQITAAEAPMVLVVGPNSDGYEMRYKGWQMEVALSFQTSFVNFTHPTVEDNTRDYLHIIRIDVPGQKTDAWVDDVLFSYIAPTTMRNVPEALYVGRREGGYPYLGTIAEALIYAGPVSDANLALLRDYLNVKHSLAAE